MTIPKCCGKRMKVNLETARFLEVWCGICDDVVYIKKDDIQGPQMLDD